MIQEVLALIRDIGRAYEKAPFELKRLYLGLFWDEFRVTEKHIVEARKARIVLALEAVGAMSDSNAPEAILEAPPTTVREAVASGEKVRIRTFRGALMEEVRTCLTSIEPLRG